MRKSLIVAGGLALALALSACGGVGDGKYQDVDSLAKAASASTKEAKSSAFTMTMEMGPITMDAEGAGVYDGTETKMHMTMSMDMSALAAGLSDIDMEARLIGRDMYMKMPDNLPGISVDAAKPWFKADLEDVLPASGLDVNKYMEQTDPGNMIELLKNSGELVETEPGLSVNDEAVTRYRFEVDFDKLMQQYGGSMDSVQNLPDVDLDAVPMDVYLNNADLPIRMHVDLSDAMEEIVDEAGGEDALPPGVNFDKAFIQMDFSAWGEEVTVEQPPANEITDAPLPGGGS